MDIIKVSNLVKSYEKVNAVKGISFTVKKGEFVAFLGENGAGKSTTINIISTLLKKTAGEIIVNSHLLDKDDEEIRKDIGIVFQGKMLDDFLSVKENIVSRGQLYGLSKKEITNRINDIGKKIGITSYLNRPYGKLSGGQKRRADIVRALVNRPKILILDEPTTGLDPFTRQSVWDCIVDLQKASGLTVFLTTHYMEEAAKADRIIIIDKGEIVENDTPSNLKLKYSHDVLRLYPKNIDMIIAKLTKECIQYKAIKDRIDINIKSSLDAIDIINNIKAELNRFEVINGNMDQVFMALASNSKERG